MDELNSTYLPYSKLKKVFNLNAQTYRNWVDKGIIRAVVTPSGTRLYNTDDVKSVFNIQNQSLQCEKIIYARVSSSHQADDLKRQIQLLSTHYPDHTIISDIASGLNWKRKGLTSLLDKIYCHSVQQVVVLYKDRLCRFGWEWIAWLCKKTGTKLLVHCETYISHTFHSPREELAEDLLSVINVFVARNNGLRSSQNRKQRQKEKKEERSSRETLQVKEDSPCSILSSD